MKENKATWSWMPGIFVIAIGVIFLLGNVTDIEIGNWWAYFILIPAIGIFVNVYNSYRRDGYLSSSTRGSLIGGLMMTLVAAIFIFGWSWSAMWPVFIIVVGLGMLFSGFGRPNEKSVDDSY